MLKEIKPPGHLVVSTKVKTIYSVLILLGVVTFGVTLMKNAERAWYAYLVAFFYMMTLSLGGLFFTALQHATKAGWSVNVRRVCESFTAFLPVGLVLGILFLIGSPHVYEWLNPTLVASDELLQHKAPYLNKTFFWIRMIGFFGLWLWFSKQLVGRSLEQDKNGEVQLTLKSVPYAVACLVVFALTYTFFSIDTLMSLQPHWFSTMFGVYTFSGLFQSTMALMILVILYLQNQGLLKDYVNESHLHDLGKFLFAFTVFWAYIAFSQFMLIWYANMPEETIFYLPRMGGSWVCVSLALLIFRFVVPFIALLPRWAKRTPSSLAAVSVLVLIMEYVDLYWLAYPNYNEAKPVFSLPEVGIFLGFAGLFIFSITRFLSRNPVVAYRDPRIEESLQHHI